MRTWLLRHPHVGLLLAVAWWVNVLWLTTQSGSRHQWGWLALDVAVLVDASFMLHRAWRRT